MKTHARMCLDAGGWDVEVLHRQWRHARPFPHLVIDDALDVDSANALCMALAEESADRIVGEIYEVMATGETFEQPALTALQRTLSADNFLATLSEVTGVLGLSRCSMRGYAYGPGHYLLPHADRDADQSRALAYALYVDVSDDLEGGELELFESRFDRGAIDETTAASEIAPRAGRMVLLDVSDGSLHRVREVTRGRRVSLSGWFYR